MSRPPREPNEYSHSMLRLGQLGFGHRWSASPWRSDELGPARGTRRGELPPPSALLALGEHRPDDLGDHVARPADDDHVALAHVLASDLVLVVQRGVRDRHAADDDRLEHRERRHLPRASGVDVDLPEQRGALLGRELVGDRPPWRVAGGAELLLQRDLVHLDHGAVDLPVDAVPVGLPVLEVGHHPVDVPLDLGGRGHGQPGITAPVQEARVRVEPDPLRVPERVHEQGQRAGGGDLGVLLSERARRGVARVRERPLLGGEQLLVQPLERLHRQVDLAADLEVGGRILHLEPLGDAAHRPDVGGDVLADPAVPSGRALREHAVLVGQRHRDPVDLELAGIAGARPDTALDPGHPRLDLLTAERVVEREHRRRGAPPGRTGPWASRRPAGWASPA